MYNAFKSTVTNRNKPTVHLAQQWKREKYSCSTEVSTACGEQSLTMRSQLNIKNQIENHIKEAFEDLDVGEYLFVVEKL